MSRKIVNKLGKREMEEVLDSIGASRPTAAETVRGLLFTFDDIRKLPPRTRIALFESIEADRLVPALNRADDEMKEFILSSVPSRTRRVIEQDLAVAPPMTEDLGSASAQRSAASMAAPPWTSLSVEAISQFPRPARDATPGEDAVADHATQ